MINYLTEFVLRCHKKGIRPDESHIQAYLGNVGKLEYLEPFIKICFWYWDELIE